MSRIIYYYQQFCGLEKVLENPKCTHIHVSSVHFGKNDDGSPYIHINDENPDSPANNKMWEDVEKASKLGIRIVLMIGGAGGGFRSLFSDFYTYYNMLKDTIKKHPYVTGVDLDIEEIVSLDSVRALINAIVEDFGDEFIISFAPLITSLQYDEEGMGGFVYKALLISPEGGHIHYFNAQSYYSFTVDDYEKCINNGYPSEMLVMGMLSEQYSSDVLNVVESLVKKYGKSFGGVFDWEYFNAEPNPEQWSINMDKIINSNKSWLSFFLNLIY